MPARRSLTAFLLLTTLSGLLGAKHAWADLAPVVTAPASVTGSEGTATFFTVTAADPDGDAITDLTMSPSSTGATFTRNATMTSGSFSWSPNYTQSGVYDFTFTASNALSGSAVTRLTVQNVDRAPIVTAPPSATINMNLPYTLTVFASDPDGNPIPSLTASPLPPGATFTANASNTAGTFAWTPSSVQVGSHTVTFTASNALSGSASTTLTVTTIDNRPVVTAPGLVQGSAGALISFTVSASDPDADAITSLTASGPAVTAGGVFTTNASNTSGTLNWMPSAGQEGNYYALFLAANALSGNAQTNIAVTSPGDDPPVVTAPSVVGGFTNVPFTFTVGASDPEGDPISSLTAAPLPPGATFTSNAAHSSGTFSWTPTSAQRGTYNVTFTATNVLTGSATTAISITDGSRPPIVSAPATASGFEGLPITFTVSASDPDADAISSLTGSGPAVTAGGTFSANASNTSGTFSWTPAVGQIGSYLAIFTATNTNSGSDSTVVVVATDGGGDHEPVVTAPANQTVALNSLLTFAVSAADPDGEPINSLTAAPLPSGATFTSNAAHTSGTFSWTPNIAQEGAYTIVFTAANALSGSAATQIQAGGSDRAPVVLGPFTFTIVAGTQGSFPLTATDPDGDPISSFTASGTAISAGGTFTKNASNSSGTFTWTPSVTQLGSYSVTFLASNSLSGAVTTLITVVQDLLAPLVTAPSLITGFENAMITFTVSASDPDDAITSLTAAPLPTGATFSSNATHTAGTFGWTPTLSQSGTYSVTFTAANAMIGLATTTITVRDLCQRPVAVAGGPYSGVAAVPIQFDGTGSSDPSGGTLAYLWYFGDGTSGTGATPTHTYATPGFYQVQLTVTSSCGSDVDVTSIVIYDSCISAFTVGGNQTLRLNSGKQTWCVQMEPFPTDCFAASDVDITSITLEYTGGAVTQIHALTDKTSVSGDRNGNGVQEVTACFSKDDLRLLFSALPAGYSGVVATVRLRLVTGGQVSGLVGVRVFANGSTLAASVSPNPFNPRAVLSFRTTREGFARGRLFDTSGRLVRTLLDERSIAVGYHEVVLDGRGAAGESLPSGIYYYRMETGEGTASGRVVLLK